MTARALRGRPPMLHGAIATDARIGGMSGDPFDCRTSIVSRKLHDSSTSP
jgi:hypothetical protein